MKAVLSPPSFLLLDSLRVSSRVLTFEEILASSVDEDTDYHRLTDHGVRSSLHSESLGLVLFCRPIGVLADLTAEFDEASRCLARSMELVDTDDDIVAGTEVAKPTDAIPNKSVFEESQRLAVLTSHPEVGVVRETLSEVLANEEPSFPSVNAVKTGP